MTTDDARARVRQVNSLRFSWHEHILQDGHVRRYPTALALAGHIMHRFRPDLGYAEVSFKGAAKALNLEPRSVVRARDVLVKRGWIALKEKRMSQQRGWAANRYTLSGGPDDLLIEEHAVDDMSDISPLVTRKALGE